MDAMSSEDSCYEDEKNSNPKVAKYAVRRLPWECRAMKKIKKELDFFFFLPSWTASSCMQYPERAGYCIQEEAVQEGKGKNCYQNRSRGTVRKSASKCIS